MRDASWTTSASSGLPYRIRLPAGWEYQQDGPLGSHVEYVIPYAYISARTNAPTGGALWLSFLSIGLFAVVAGRGVFGSGRQPPDGQMAAIVDLRLAFFTRLSIQVFFLTAMLVMGVATQLPVLLVTSVFLLAIDLGLPRLVDQRRAAAGLPPARAVPLAPVVARLRPR
jgi:hypothetical protein